MLRIAFDRLNPIKRNTLQTGLAFLEEHGLGPGLKLQATRLGILRFHSQLEPNRALRR